MTDELTKIGSDDVWTIIAIIVSPVLAPLALTYYFAQSLCLRFKLQKLRKKFVVLNLEKSILQEQVSALERNE